MQLEKQRIILSKDGENKRNETGLILFNYYAENR